MLDLDVIDNPATAIVALDPTRRAILELLVEPGSATSVAAALDLPRQRVNYHLRALESHGLVRLVERRARRGLTERVLVATARGYLVSPAALGDQAADPARLDRLSGRYLVALAARVVREVVQLTRRAEHAGKTLPTLAIDTDVRFASAADRAAFTAQLTDAVTALVARYHDETAPGGRWHRVMVAGYPRPAPQPATLTDP